APLRLVPSFPTRRSSDLPAWTSHVIPEARGEILVAPDGTRTAVRYKGWTARDFGAFRTYAYDDARPEPPVQKATMPANVVGDPRSEEHTSELQSLRHLVC